MKGVWMAASSKIRGFPSCVTSSLLRASYSSFTTSSDSPFYQQTATPVNIPTSRSNPSNTSKRQIPPPHTFCPMYNIELLTAGL